VCGRGGRQLNRHPSSIVLERIRRWERGEIKNLVDEADALRRSTTTRSARRGRGPMSGNEPADQGFSDGARRAIRRAIQDGALSKAAKIALSDHCELMTDAEEPLRRLHPPGNPVACSVDDTFIVDFEAEEVTRAIKSFPPGSSGGPSGLRASHLVCPDSSIHNRLVGALAKFASLFASGRLPPHCRVLCQARLIALPKKPSGVRPIAVGETLRRIAAKCLVARFQPEAVENLTPLQLGVGVPGAAEVVVHHYSHWRREVPADSDNAMLLIDFANAFNTLDRGSMIDAIKSRAPQFYNYATRRRVFPLVGAWHAARGCMRPVILFRGRAEPRGISCPACAILEMVYGRWFSPRSCIVLAAGLQPHRSRGAQVGPLLERDKMCFVGSQCQRMDPVRSIRRSAYSPLGTGDIPSGSPHWVSPLRVGLHYQEDPRFADITRQAKQPALCPLSDFNTAIMLGGFEDNVPPPCP